MMSLSCISARLGIFGITPQDSIPDKHYGDPALLEFAIDNDEKVLPMVAPGDSIDRLILSVDGAE